MSLQFVDLLNKALHTLMLLQTIQTCNNLGASGEPEERFHPLRADYRLEDKDTTNVILDYIERVS